MEEYLAPMEEYLAPTEEYLAPVEESLVLTGENSGLKINSPQITRIDTDCKKDSKGLKKNNL